MKAVVTYLFFEGNCREAMRFYAEALGAELDVMDAKDAPQCPEGKQGQVLHARLHTAGLTVLMASDNMMSERLGQGRNFRVSVDCESQAEMDRMFGAMREGGTVSMEPQDTFWGAKFGMLEDRFGVGWMFNFDEKQPG